MHIATEILARRETNGTRTHADFDPLEAAFARMKAAHRSDPMPSCERRIAWLDALAGMVRSYRREIADTICEDFGNRSFHETQLAEIATLLGGIRHMKKNLRAWMAPGRRRVDVTLRPGRASIHPRPLGVVGIIAPWNYPCQLALAPAAAALAAGNRVMIKPSELTPRTALLLRRLIRDAFEPELVTVVTGGPDVGSAFASLPFDHLLFTGSLEVGRKVMRAAAENLTPVTLELGGKSPALVHERFSVSRAARRLVRGKWFNAGQTCIAPDYLLVHRSKVGPMTECLRRGLSRAYPALANNPDYTSIATERHYDRIRELIADAEARGARKIEVNPALEQLDPAGRKIAPTLLLDVHDDMRVMQEEIFGPVLPIVTYGSLDEALDYIADRPAPLAFYYFDDDRARVQLVLEQTASGGATINDTLMHFAADDLPFGGVGPSGIGAYHGIEGFCTFSHRRGVFHAGRVQLASRLGPPYHPHVDRVLDIVLGR